MGEKSRMNEHKFHHTLSSGLKSLGIDESLTNKLLEFLFLLEKWNKTYNLTAIRSLEDMITLHILDSATVYSYLKGNSILDVGSGGGIPGIIFAIINPQLKLTLLDSSQKKTRFLRFISRQMKLKNVEVVCQRVEKYEANATFDVVISRAFSEVGQFLKFAGHLCKHNGKMYAMKGPRIESEKTSQEFGFKLVKEYDLKVPNLNVERRLLIFEKL